MINLDLATVSSIVIAILGIVGGVGFWQYRISRKDAPVRKQEADMAVAEKSQQMAMAIAERLDIDYQSVRTDLGKAQGAISTLQTQLHDLQVHAIEQDRTISSLRRTVRSFSDAWDDLVHNWARYRLSEAPPQRPTTALDFEE